MAKKPTRKQLAQSGIMMPTGYDEIETPAQRLKGILGPEHGGDAKPAKSSSKSKTKKAEPNEDGASDGPPEDGSGDSPPEDSGGELEPWTLKSSPAEYLDTYGDGKPNSALARAYVEAGKGDVTA